MSKNDFPTMTVYYFEWRINHQGCTDETSMTTLIYNAKVWNHGFGPLETKYGDKIQMEELDKIHFDGYKLIMYSLNSNIENFKEKLVKYNASMVIEHLKRIPWFYDTKLSSSDEIEIEKYVNKFIKKYKENTGGNK